MAQFNLSEFGSKSLVLSPINQMTASFSKDFRQGIDINLGVGYVNDETIPHKELTECFQYVLAHTDQYKNALNYGSADGSENLRTAIRNYYIKHNIGCLGADRMAKKSICVGANGATSLLDSFASIMPKGIVITADPNYYIYIETLERNGFTVLTVPEDTEGMRVDLLEDLIQNIDVNQLSFLYIVTVNNPSSIIMSNARRQAIVRLITKVGRAAGKKIPMIFDKAYEDIIFDTTIEPVESGMLYDEDGLVVELGTLSKIIAPALRIGYAISDDTDIMRALIQKTGDIGFSAPLINQEMSARFIDTYISNHALAVRDGYRRKADFLKKCIEENLGPYLERYSGGQAGFYFYLTFKEIETHSQSSFFKFLSRTTGDSTIDGNPKNPRLVYVPGNICVSQTSKTKEVGNRQLRISYGFEDIPVLERAILLMKEAALYANKQ
ncbi:MAG: pyridoxal phosphate-dependent aminotransferase [Bacteroidales bacterium]|nr:pyridoxal phosphate-dependent aminotransferase [Bacteroidales bacterium]